MISDSEFQYTMDGMWIFHTQHPRTQLLGWIPKSIKSSSTYPNHPREGRSAVSVIMLSSVCFTNQETKNILIISHTHKRRKSAIITIPEKFCCGIVYGGLIAFLYPGVINLSRLSNRNASHNTIM